MSLNLSYLCAAFNIVHDTVCVQIFTGRIFRKCLWIRIFAILFSCEAPSVHVPVLSTSAAGEIRHLPNDQPCYWHFRGELLWALDMPLFYLYVNTSTVLK